jgi:hypothetical protein
MSETQPWTFFALQGLNLQFLGLNFQFLEGNFKMSEPCVLIRFDKVGPMMKLISMTIVSACILYMAPVTAFDNGGNDKTPVTFQSFTNMSAMERETLTPLTETELASIEGAYLEVPIVTIQQMEAIFLAILEAQRNTLGCNESCVTQIVTRLAPSLKGANIAGVYQTSDPKGSLTSYNISTVQQSSGGR